MIKTEHIRLSSAAERLGVDLDTILIFAAEGGVQLYALLSDWIYVTPELAENKEVSTSGAPSLDPESFINVPLPFPVKKYFKFIRIGSYDVSSILKRGETIWQGGICTDPDEKGVYWETAVPTPELVEMLRVSNPKRFKLGKNKGNEDKGQGLRYDEDEFESYNPEPFFLRKEDLFLKSGDVERIINGQSVASLMTEKEPEMLSPQQKGGMKKIENKSLDAISGLLFALNATRGRDVTVKELVAWTMKSGCEIGDTKARQILSECQERRKK